MSATTLELTGDDLLDAQCVLPLAICNVADGLGGSILPERGSEPPSDIFGEITKVLRAATIAAHLGGPCDPTPGSVRWTSEREEAVRAVVADWAEWCRYKEGAHATEQIMDNTPPDAVPYWTAAAERAERVLRALNEGRWGPIDDRGTA